MSSATPSKSAARRAYGTRASRASGAGRAPASRDLGDTTRPPGSRWRGAHRRGGRAEPGSRRRRTPRSSRSRPRPSVRRARPSVAPSARARRTRRRRRCRPRCRDPRRPRRSPLLSGRCRRGADAADRGREQTAGHEPKHAATVRAPHEDDVKAGLESCVDADVAQLVEHWLPKPGVVGSSPIVRFGSTPRNPALKQ